MNTKKCKASRLKKSLKKNWEKCSLNPNPFWLDSGTSETTLQKWTFTTWKNRRLKKWEQSGNKTRPFRKYMSTEIRLGLMLAVSNLLMASLCQLTKFIWHWVIEQATFSMIPIKEQSKISIFQLPVFQQIYCCKKHPVSRKSSKKKGHFSSKLPATIGQLQVMMIIMFCSEVLQAEIPGLKHTSHRTFWIWWETQEAFLEMHLSESSQFMVAQEL